MISDKTFLFLQFILQFYVNHEIDIYVRGEAPNWGNLEILPSLKMLVDVCNNCIYFNSVSSWLVVNVSFTMDFVLNRAILVFFTVVYMFRAANKTK